VERLRVCVDATIVIRRVAFPEDAPVQRVWDTWEEVKAELFAPSLLYYEVTNGLYRYQKQGWLKPETVAVSLDAALSLPIELVGELDLHRQARTIAERYNLPATYDAHYLAVCERMGADLWTSDQRLVNTLKPFQVEWVRQVGGGEVGGASRHGVT
jgi:predicted nucleic acid-binding protein